MLMNVVEIPIEQLREAPWNPNAMDGDMGARLSRSIQTYGFLVPLVVREMRDGL